MRISLNWFKSKISLKDLKIEKQQLKNDILRKELELMSPPKEDNELLFKQIFLVNDVLTVVMNNGDVLSKVASVVEDFNAVVNATCSNDILTVFYTKECLKDKENREVEMEKARAIIGGIEILNQISDFAVSNGSVCLTNTSRSLPELLISEFLKILGTYEDYSIDQIEDLLLEDEKYQSLKKFWLKCCLNPNAQSAEDLYVFLSNHQFKIDRHGNFYAYRRVVSKHSNSKKFVEFVANAYIKVKAVWKKKPINFYVSDVNGELGIHKIIRATTTGTWLGNLDDLYNNLGSVEENSYTSAHTGQEDYKIGEVISMPRFKGDDNNQISCSKGFHGASKKYDYSGFGDTPILMIINPIDVLAVPMNEVGKLRVCRWFFATTLPQDEQYILDDEDFDVTDLGDLFEEKCMTGIEEYVQNSFVEEVKRHTFTIPSISASEIRGIVLSLEQMQEEIASRILFI
jgi:hypothetical protein